MLQLKTGVTAVEGLQLESTVHSTLDPAIFPAPSELILAYTYTIGTAGKKMRQHRAGRCAHDQVKRNRECPERCMGVSYPGYVVYIQYMA